MKPKEIFEGVFKIGKKIATINLIPGVRSANEELLRVGGKEYRVWDPFTSKPAAAIKKGLRFFPIRKGMRILYLGLAEAKTATFFSDIVGSGGMIYGVEISERSLREAIRVCELRKNIVPILADARMPETYKNLVVGKIDCVYVDVASPDQVQILVDNAKTFLESGYAIIAIKSQSISSTRPPKEVYRECLEEFEKQFKILDKVELDPYEKAHLFVVMER